MCHNSLFETKHVKANDFFETFLLYVLLLHHCHIIENERCCWLLCSHFDSCRHKQNEIEILKAENDRLKSSGNATPTATPVKTARPPSETSSTSSSSSRQSLGLSLNNLNITDTIMSGQFNVCVLVQVC